jgi:GAF domain-containing protein/HAMP domain-containing protein
MKVDTILNKFLKNYGGTYIILVVAMLQLLTFIGVAFTGYMVQINAEFSFQQLTLSAICIFALLVLGNSILLVWAHLSTKDARVQLTNWAKGRSLLGGVEVEVDAWNQITSIAWKYGGVSLIVAIFIQILPLIFFLYVLGGATQEQIVYTLFGGGVATISILSVSVLALELLLLPARKLLTPSGFGAQLSGTAGIKIRTKFQVIVLGMILVSILLIGPIGYHQTVTVLYREIGSTEVFAALQNQTITVALIAISLGIGLVYLLSNAISQPINDLIKTFVKVEGGDLDQRVGITATDEIGELAIYFNRMVNRLAELQKDLERQVEERTSHLKAINEVGRVAASILDPDELISKVVNLITDEFGYYYSALFIIDSENRFAELIDATGEAGKVLRQSKHHLEINDKSMVGRAIVTKQAQVAQDVGEKSIRFNNPLLPYTRSEIALPLFIGDQILGVLDVQSTQEAAFGEQDINTLQNMANQVAVALENARLFQEAQYSIQELQEIQKNYLRESWSVSKIPEGEIVLAIGDKPDGTSGHLTNFPIALRDEVIGEININSKNKLNAEENTWVQAIITQAALALENARLLEESQNLAMRERYVTEITNKIWSANTIDGILQTSLRELGQVLDASEAIIEFNVENE